MANSAFDNLFVTPAPLPPGSAALTPASSDRRDFDDALQRAYQPAPPSDDTVDATSRRADAEEPTRNDRLRDSQSTTSQTGSERENSRDDASSSNSNDRSNRTDDNEHLRKSDRSNSPKPGTKSSPAARGKTKSGGKPESPTKPSGAAPPEPPIKQPPTEPSATSGNNPIANADASDAKTIDAANVTTPAEYKDRQAGRPSVTPQAVAVAESANTETTTTTDAHTESTPTKGEASVLALSAKVKSTEAKSKTGPQFAKDSQSELQRPDPANQPDAVGQAFHTEQQQAASSQQTSTTPHISAKESPRTLKSTGRTARVPDEAIDSSDNAANQIGPAIIAVPNPGKSVPISSTTTDSAEVVSSSTKQTDDDRGGSTGAAVNQPASLSGNHFADGLLEPAANAPGQALLPSGNAKSAAAGQARGMNQLEQARFVQRVAKAFRAADDEGGQIRIRLSPPELGSLKLEVAVRNGVMTAKLEAETNSARTLLLDNLPALRQRLADQNIKIERFDVDLRQDGHGDGSPKPPPDFSGSRQDLPGPPIPGRIKAAPRGGSEPVIAGATPGGAAGNSRINVVI